MLDTQIHIPIVPTHFPRPSPNVAMLCIERSYLKTKGYMNSHG